MRQHELDRMLNDVSLVEGKIDEFLAQGIIRKETSSGEIQGHLAKAEHNLEFIKDISSTKFLDWTITGCYYACYHAALALILTKGYSSKNHLATLCVLIKEFYPKELSHEDIQTISSFLDYQDVLFYVESKNRREDATYSTKTRFTKQMVEELRIKAALFVAKIKRNLEEK